MGTPHQRRWRGRGLRWAATLILAVVAGAIAAATVQRAEQARAAYGELTTVPVAVRELAVGDEVDGTAFTWAELPAAMLPVGVADDPVGRIVVEPVAEGEVVLDRRLAGGGSGLAALLSPGSRAIAVPLDAGAPTVSVGDRVDAFAPSTGAAALADVARGRLSAAERVARGALVVAVQETSATIAVTAAEAPGVAGALIDGALLLALVAPG